MSGLLHFEVVHWDLSDRFVGVVVGLLESSVEVHEVSIRPHLLLESFFESDADTDLSGASEGALLFGSTLFAATF